MHGIDLGRLPIAASKANFKLFAISGFDLELTFTVS